MSGDFTYRVKQMKAKGLSARDIACVTGRPRSDVLRVLGRDAPDESDVQDAKRKMLREIPAWWRGDSESYVRCVEANFGS